MFALQNDPAAEELRLRVATPADRAALTVLVARSFRTLAAGFYGAAQLEAAIGTVIRVDEGLVADGTYFIVEQGARAVACGGYSERISAVPGGRSEPRPEIRAMFVAPEMAGCGLGNLLLRHAERRLARAGHARVYLHATLSGEPFYRRRGYVFEARLFVPLPNSAPLECVTMSRALEPVALTATRDTR